MNDEACTMAVNAMATADKDHGRFRSTLATAYWQLHNDSAEVTWQATLVTHSSQVRAAFDTEEKAMVWMANRLGAIMLAHE